MIDHGLAYEIRRCMFGLADMQIDRVQVCCRCDAIKQFSQFLEWVRLQKAKIRIHVVADSSQLFYVTGQHRI